MALIATACSGGRSTSNSSAPEKSFDVGGGVTVVAPAGSIDRGARIVRRSADSVIPDLPPGFVAAGTPVALELDRGALQLHGLVHVEIPVDRAVLADVPVDADSTVPVFHLHGSDAPGLLLGSLDRQRAVITVNTDRFSIFQPIIASAKQLLAKVGDIANGFFGDIFPSAQSPTCTNESAARADGWTVSSTNGPTARWCFGIDGSQRTLAVANGRRYTLIATIGSAMSVTGQPPQVLSSSLSQALSEALGQHNQIVLPAGGLAQIATTPAQGHATSLHAEFDGFAQAISTLQLAGELMAEIASKLSFGHAKGAEEALAAIAAGGCVPKLLELAADPGSASKVGAMVAACLRPDYFVKGVASVALAGLLATIGSTLSFLITSGQALLDQVRGRSDYTITVKRGVAGTVDIRTVDLTNATMPPKSCASGDWLSPNPIPLVSGSGHSGDPNADTAPGSDGKFRHAEASIVGNAEYADFDADGNTDALVTLLCSAGGNYHDKLILPLTLRNGQLAFVGGHNLIAVAGDSTHLSRISDAHLDGRDIIVHEMYDTTGSESSGFLSGHATVRWHWNGTDWTSQVTRG